MPNPKLETYKNKATGTVYDFTDADAQSKVTATVDLLKDTTGWIGGNKCPKFTNQSKMNAVFTVDDDGIVTPSGTATAQTQGENQFTLKAGKYRLSGAPAGSSSGSYDIYIQNMTAGGGVIARDYDGTSLQQFTLSVDSVIRVNLRVPEGEVDSTKIFKPMICTPEQYALNPSYRPYHGSAEEVKADKSSVISVLDDTVGWIGKNHFNNKQAVADRTQTTNRTITDTGVRVTNTEATTYGYVRFNLRLSANTDYTISSKITRNGGVCHIMIKGSADDTTYTTLLEKTYNTGDIEDTFNTGNNTYVRLYLYCSLTESVVGDITYDELMIVDTATYNLSPTFEPYHESVEEMFDTVNRNLKYRNVRLQDIPNEGSIYDKVVNIAEQLDALVTDVGVKFSGYVLWTQSMFLRVEAIRCNATTLLYTIFNASYTIYNGNVQNGVVSVYKFEGTQMTS